MRIVAVARCQTRSKPNKVQVGNVLISYTWQWRRACVAIRQRARASSLPALPSALSPSFYSRHSTHCCCCRMSKRQPVITTSSQSPRLSARLELLWSTRLASTSPRINRKPAPNVINGLLCGCATRRVALFALAFSYCSMSMGLGTAVAGAWAWAWHWIWYRDWAWAWAIHSCDDERRYAAAAAAAARPFE